MVFRGLYLHQTLQESNFIDKGFYFVLLGFSLRHLDVVMLTKNGEHTTSHLLWITDLNFQMLN